MPFNQIKIYNQLLEISGLNPHDRNISLKAIFDRDFTNKHPVYFNGKQVIPCPNDGVIEMETLYRHLTTVVTDKNINQREFDIHRSNRLHWVRHHIDGKKKHNIICFSIKEPNGLRTYLYDEDEKYVIIFEPRIQKNIYFLLTAYHLRGKDAERDKIKMKMKRKLNDIL
jgi:hypothetical protein